MHFHFQDRARSSHRKQNAYRRNNCAAIKSLLNHFPLNGVHDMTEQVLCAVCLYGCMGAVAGCWWEQGECMHYYRSIDTCKFPILHHRVLVCVCTSVPVHNYCLFGIIRYPAATHSIERRVLLCLTPIEDSRNNGKKPVRNGMARCKHMPPPSWHKQINSLFFYFDVAVVVVVVVVVVARNTRARAVDCYVCLCMSDVSRRQ